MKLAGRHASLLLGAALVSACGVEDYARGRAALEPGAVTIHASELNMCPRITLMLVAPLETSLGAPISLFAEADDPDGDPTLPLWETSAGSIVDPEATDTALLCEHEGEGTVTFSVFDSAGCEQQLSTPVTCR